MSADVQLTLLVQIPVTDETIMDDSQDPRDDCSAWGPSDSRATSVECSKPKSA